MAEGGDREKTLIGNLKQTKQRDGLLKVGFGKIEITPKDRVSLAGYFSLRPRISRGVRDPLFVRAIAFQEGETLAVLIVYDTLMTTEALFQAVNERLKETKAMVMTCATHTHSSFGGYWDSFVPKLALGPYKKGVLEFLADTGADAAKAAIGDLSEARIALRSDNLPKLARNRRDEKGAIDDKLWTLAFDRGDKGIGILTGFSGHPVIVAERDYWRVSADFPGEVIRRIEQKTAFAAFVNGALGGVDVFFPDEEITADENLDLQSAPIVEASLKILDAPDWQSSAKLRFASREVPLNERPNVRMMYDDQPAYQALLWPLNRFISKMFSLADIDRYRLQAIRLGDALMLGTPADLGVSVSLAIQRYANESGIPAAFVISQADGYIGYIHRKADYENAPGVETMGMGIYENVMGIFGREMGEKLLDEAKRLIDSLS